jgi:hypothetical protein
MVSDRELSLAKLDGSRRAFTACARAWFRDPCLENRGPVHSERLSPYRATERAFRIVLDGFPDAAATPHSGLAHPIHHSRDSIQSSRQRRLGSRMVRPPAPYCVLQRLREYDPRYVRPTTATNTVNNLHPRFARLPRASNFAISRSFAHSVHGAFSRRSTRFGDSTRFSSSALSSASEAIFDSADDLEVCVLRSSLNRANL